MPNGRPCFTRSKSRARRARPTWSCIGDSASVIDQAKGVARRRLDPDVEARFVDLAGRFDRLQFRRIKRTQNLAGIALEKVNRRSQS